jgi:PGF-CTERM protein
MKCDNAKKRRNKYIMNRKPVLVLLLLALAILAGAPESFARPQYLTSLTAVYGDGSCGTCHIRASGGGARNDYGTLFENQPDHATDPGAALTAIGTPTTASSTLTPAPTSTMEAVATLTETSTPIATETSAEPAALVTPTGTQATPGFGIVVSLVGLFICALLVRRNNK